MAGSATGLESESAGAGLAAGSAGGWSGAAGSGRGGTSAVAAGAGTGLLDGFLRRGLEMRRTTGAGESGSGVASDEGSLWGMWEVKVEMAKGWKGRDH